MNELAFYLDQPREVSLETLTLCNARCNFCPYPALDRKGTKMPTDKIYSLIDEMSVFKRPFFFSPFKVNEPFLDDRLQDICERFLARCVNGQLRLFTNGTRLTRTNLQWVESLSRVEHLWISLNATDPEEYRTLMGLSFDLTAKRLDEFHRYTFQGWPHPVVLSRVATDDMARNHQFVMDCRQRWPLFQAVLLKRDGWLGHVTPGSPYIPSTPCARWCELSILATGRVALCCMDSVGDYPLGDVYRQTLLEIYNIAEFRERRIGTIARRSLTPCNRCTY